MPIVPGDARKLAAEQRVRIVVQPSPQRAIKDEEYRDQDVRVSEDLSECKAIFGVKEIPIDQFLPNKAYVFFSHVIKGQPYNMPMLQRMLDLKCHLIDYEKIVDDKGKRLIFFGNFAGYAGMIDTLWALGKRLEWEGAPNLISGIREAKDYADLAEARAAIKAVGERIAKEGLPAMPPVICGFSGYGNVAKGASEIFELLPFEEIDPRDVARIAQGPKAVRHKLYKVVFKEEHSLAPNDPAAKFDLKDYYASPDRYHAVFADYLPHLTMLVNCIYWDARYPRLVTKKDVTELFGAAGQPNLRVIGDISCDIEGSIECTIKSTDPANPVFVYDVSDGDAHDGVAGKGPVIMAVEILPSELPRDASVFFSDVLRTHVNDIAMADYSVPFERLDLPPELKRAVIVYQGELTPDYKYIEKHLAT